ncbi:MAG: signal peptidase I [Planctomycetes bacterium]|nr:signal peptidase I [Planctomycetota bacterium]
MGERDHHDGRDDGRDDCREERSAAVRRFEESLRTAPRLLIALMVLIVLLAQTTVSSYRVAGASMTPAFADGDRIVVASLPGFFGEPRCGETVIARVADEVLLKRVVGRPGDLIEEHAGVLHRNGQLLADASPAAFHDGGDFGPVRLGPGEYFLMGDHRRVSIDSREFGPVARDALLGRVILRVPAPRPAAPQAVLARE